jgi:hypothetical protein
MIITQALAPTTTEERSSIAISVKKNRAGCSGEIFKFYYLTYNAVHHGRANCDSSYIKIST